MKQITPYLNFNGNASEALALYTKAFEGSVLYQQTFQSTPEIPVPEEMVGKVMHAHFKSGGLEIMVSDSMPNETVTSGTNTYLSLNFSDVAPMDKTFEILSGNGKIRKPLQDTFWGARFGICTDQFGINWMFNYDYPKDEKDN